MSKLVVKKSNFLIPRNEAISKSAQLLASYLVARLPKADEGVADFPVLHFTYEELKQAINADGRARVCKVDDIFQLGVELQQCILFYVDEEARETVSWIIGQRHDLKRNTFTYSLHPGLKEYLLNLKKQFTYYNYLYRVCLCANSMKLYEILKMNQFRKSVILDIEEELKPALGLVGRYKKYYDLRRKVLDVAQKEFRQFTDIGFNYEPADKKGKKVIRLRFIIYENSPSDLPKPILEILKTREPQALPEPEEAKREIRDNILIFKERYSKEYKQLQVWGGGEDAIQHCIKVYGEKELLYQIKHLENVLKQNKSIENPFAWLSAALKGEYLDNRQEKEKEKKERKQQKDELEKHRKVLQKKVDDLKVLRYKERLARCEQMFEAKPYLLKEIVDSNRNNPIISSRFNIGDDVNILLQDAVAKSTIASFVFKQYPERFADIEEKYELKIRLAERKLNNLGQAIR